MYTERFLLHIQLHRSVRPEHYLTLLTVLMTETKALVSLTEDCSVLEIDVTGLSRVESRQAVMTLIYTLSHAGYLQLSTDIHTRIQEGV